MWNRSEPPALQSEELRKREKSRGDVELGGGASFPGRPLAIRDRAKQTVNYPDNTGEEVKGVLMEH